MGSSEAGGITGRNHEVHPCLCRAGEGEGRDMTDRKVKNSHTEIQEIFTKYFLTR